MPVQESYRRCRNSPRGHRPGPPSADGHVFCVHCGRPLDGYAPDRPRFWLFAGLVLACMVASVFLFWLYCR